MKPIVPLALRYNRKVIQERRVFGRRPQTIGLALRNLPDVSHPLYDRDQSIQHLAALRQVLVQSILHYQGISQFPIPLFPRSLVENKMIPLTDEDVQIMEKYSFFRSGLVGVGLFAPPDTNEGRTLNNLISDSDGTAWITAWRLAPWGLDDFPLTLIEPHQPEDPIFPFTAGVLSPEEFSGLPHEIDQILYDLACQRRVARLQASTFASPA